MVNIYGKFVWITRTYLLVFGTFYLAREDVSSDSNGISTTLLGADPHYVRRMMLFAVIFKLDTSVDSVLIEHNPPATRTFTWTTYIRIFHGVFAAAQYILSIFHNCEDCWLGARRTILAERYR